jgi:predicted dehydrogenase
VIGYGSIGRRHARNLRTLGCCNLQIFDPVSNAASDDGAQRFESLESLLASKPDIVLITSPSVLHEEQLFNVLAAGIRNVFVEKPFVCSLARSDDLLQAAAPATVMIGCNFRFHPGIRTLKNLLDQSTLGTPIFARIEAGQYLPSWQPNSDYRLRYSAKIALGGGALLDYIHEVDYANWLFGSPQSVFANVGASGSLEIETDDFADLSVTYSAGLSATIHVDYLQPRRGYGKR